jgi:hypothetical protein
MSSGRVIAIEHLEPRLALAITVPISNLTNLPSDQVYVTGHGIPGWQAAGAAPLYLLGLDGTGKFNQVATEIGSAASSGTTATITTSYPHGLATGDSVFIAGIGSGYDGVYTLTGAAGTTFTVTTSDSDLPTVTAPPGTASVYEESLISSNTIVAVQSSSFGPTQSGPIFTLTTPHHATVTTPYPLGLVTGNQITIAGVTGAPSGAYDGTFTLTKANPGSNTIEFSYDGAPWPDPSSVDSTKATVEGLVGLAQITTTTPHGLAVGETIQVSGVTPAAYNGIATVAQIVDGTHFEYSYAAPAALPPGAGGAVKSAALRPVNLTDLPPGGMLTLDATLTNISAKLIVYVTGKGDPVPVGLPLSGNGVSPSDDSTPPYRPGSPNPGGVFDIVEFAYLPTGAEWDSATQTATITTTSPHGLAVGHSVTVSKVISEDGKGTLLSYNGSWTVSNVLSPLRFQYSLPGSEIPDGGTGQVVGPETVAISGSRSTFDLSAVDGLAIPMTLTAPSADVTPTEVDGKQVKLVQMGVRPQPHYTREAIATAFKTFMNADPDRKAFAKLLYGTEVDLTAITGASATWSGNVATFTYAGTPVITKGMTVNIDGFAPPNRGYNQSAVEVQSASGTMFTVTNTDSTLQSASGGVVTPVLFEDPGAVNGQFFTIAAPKDWLANQPAGTASSDPLASYWDSTLERFFASGRSLSIYLNKDPNHPIYSGSSDGTQYTLTNGVNSYTFPRPAAGLAGALYVWQQANPGSGDQGLLQDQIWAAICRGVAIDGVSATPISGGESSAAWADPSKWYTRHSSAVDPNFTSVYCPSSKFLHESTLDGTADATGKTSIFVHNSAYAFSEDENPIAVDYKGPQAPSKFDGTIKDGAVVTLALRPWVLTSPSATTIVSIVPEAGPTISSPSADWIVTFSAPVVGLTANHFHLESDGLGGAPSVTGVTGLSGGPMSQIWRVTTGTGTGSGACRLSLVTATSITDGYGGTVAIPLDVFTSGPLSVRSMPKPPVVEGISLAGSATTASPTVGWSVRFSDDVRGVSAANFQIVAGGLSGPRITQVAPEADDPSVWFVTALAGSGRGSLRLDLVTADGIAGLATGLSPAMTRLAGASYTVERLGATSVRAPLWFATTTGVAAKLVWPNAPFSDRDSSPLTVTLSVAGTGTLSGLSGAGVTAAPVAGAPGEMHFTGTISALNAYFMSPRGFIRYTPGGESLLPRPLTLSAQGSDGLSGLATSSVLVRSAVAQAAPTLSLTGLLSPTAAGAPVVITHEQLAAATRASGTDSRSIRFVLDGVVRGKLEIWSGSRWLAVSARNTFLLAPGGQMRWTPPSGQPGMRAAFSVRASDGWRWSGRSTVYADHRA